jgi:tetratricopeptide (TPR) repeat protein
MLVLLALLLPALPGCTSFASSGMNAEGARLFQQAQYAAAAQQFQQVIYTDPNNADAYYNLAAVYHRTGVLNKRKADLEQAENLYNQCLDHDSEHCDCYRGLAVLLVEQGRSDESFRLLEGWCDRQPTSAEARIELARLYEEFKDPRASLQQLSEALTLDPNNARALAAMGKLREGLGENVQAMANYQRSLTANRFQPEVAARLTALQTATGVSAPMVSMDGPTRLTTKNANLRR